MLKELPGPTIVKEADNNHLERYAQISWEAVKLGVANGYLPDVELGQDPDDMDDSLGVRNKMGFIQERLGASTEEDKNYHCLVVEVDEEVVAGGMISYKSGNDFVCFSSLAVSEKYAGNGYTIALRYSSLMLVQELYPEVEYISIGRYPRSVEYTKQNFSEDSYFNQIIQLSERTEEMEWEGEKTTFYDIPIPAYSQLIQEKAEKYGFLE